MSALPAPASAPVDVDAVAAAIAACPSIAHLVHGSPGEQIATFLPGRRVGGIRVTDEALEVHVATRWDAPIPAAAAEVRAALAPLVGTRAITVSVDDVDDPQAALPATTPDGPPLELAAAPASAAISAPAGADPVGTIPLGAADGEPPDPVASPS